MYFYIFLVRAAVFFGPRYEAHCCRVAYCMAGSGSAVYCDICESWLNGPTQWEDHRIGKKHKKNLKRQQGGSFKNAGKEKGIEIPKGTAFLIEQTAIYNDAVQVYTLDLYRRAALRARL